MTLARLENLGSLASLCLGFIKLPKFFNFPKFTPTTLKIYNFYCSFPLSAVRFTFFYIYLYPEVLRAYYINIISARYC